ncbi:DEAD/DEAH box helicase [Paenibacillus alvei]|nr:DEAD/DEAH box helicase [Paenibacillus alvei]
MSRKTYDQAYNHPALNSTIDLMLNYYISNSFQGGVSGIEIPEIKKAGWVASILASSNQDIHKQKAQTFAALLFLLFNEDINCTKLSYIIFSRTGNMLATKFLSTLYNQEQKGDITFKYDFGTVLDFEVGLKRYSNTIELDTENLITSDFQKQLWENLNSEGNIAISAPTSSGKSFIIQSYVKYKFHELDAYSVLYIVPSKALLNQVSEQFRSILSKDTMIRTAHIDQQGSIEDLSKYKKIMYVLTPERCLSLLNQNRDTFIPDFIFIDEIQNIEDEEGRGVIMEYVLGVISRKWDKAQLVTAGPYISKSDDLFLGLFNRSCVKSETVLSPVFQIKGIVTPNIQKNQLDLHVKVIHEIANKIVIPIKVNYDVEREFQKNMGKIMSKVVKDVSRDEQSIIYAPRTDFAESWSLELMRNSVSKDNSAIKELVDFLKEEIHPKYYLVKCLTHGIAFHHSKLPELVRREIESLFEKGDISFLFCTSTLIQGVNLPAKNLFLISPRKKSDKLTLFEFGNLIGRAGRIRDSLYGSIYYISKEPKDEVLADKYFSETYQKEVKTASSIALNQESFISDLKNINLDVNKNKNSYTICILRHKFLNDKEELSLYLEQKNLGEKQASTILEELSSQLSNIQLPSNITKLNPSVDPLLQNTLYQLIINEGIDKWVITRNSNFYKRIKKVSLGNYEFRDMSFYWQFAILCRKLDDVFSIQRETYFKHSISGLGMANISHFAFRWLQNMSYKEIIDGDIHYFANVRKEINPENEADINNRINEVMNIHSKVITFTLVKYFKVLTDILEYILDDDMKEKHKLTLSLPVMLELGTMDPIMIQLISSGINRSVALKILKEFQKVKEYTEVNIIEWLYDNGDSINLKPIYKKYIKELGFIR